MFAFLFAKTFGKRGKSRANGNGIVFSITINRELERLPNKFFGTKSALLNSKSIFDVGVLRTQNLQGRIFIDC